MCDFLQRSAFVDNFVVFFNVIESTKDEPINYFTITFVFKRTTSGFIGNPIRKKEAVELDATASENISM